MQQGTADFALLGQLIAAVQSAKALPTEFGIQSMTPDGIRGFRVLVVDDSVWARLRQGGLANLVTVTLPLPVAPG